MALNNLESEIPNQKKSLVRVKANVVPLTTISGHMPPKEAAKQFFWLARIQASSFLDAAQFLCDLFQVEGKLNSEEFIKRKLPLDGIKMSRKTPNELCDDDRVKWAVPIAEWIEKEGSNIP